MIYVDDLRAPFRGWLMSHLTADAEQELNEFADGLGLDRAWIQSAGTPKFHYDVTENKRRQAILAGAKAVTVQEMAAMVNARQLAAVAARKE